MINAASEVFKISRLSPSSCTFNASLNLEFDQIWSSTTPDGFWVAKIKCTPRLRPIRAVEINSAIKSGCSFFNSANSSLIRNRCGIGMVASPFLNSLLYPLIWFTPYWLNIVCLLISSLLMDAMARMLSVPSKFVIVPSRCGRSLNSPAIPPPL